MNGRVFILGVAFGFSMALVAARLYEIIEVERIQQRLREQLDNWGKS